MNKLFILSGILLLAACTANEHKKNVDNRSKPQKAIDELVSKLPDTKGLNAGVNDYSLYVPPGWTTEKRREYDIDFFFLRPPRTNNGFNANVNVITEDMHNLSLEEYRKKGMEYLVQSVPSAIISGTGDIEAKGIKGNWYSYQVAPQGIKVASVCYILPHDGVAYSITAASQPADTLRYRRTFDSIARSLKFKE